VADALRGTVVAYGGQDLYWEREGAFTGEISGAMLAECGCRYVIVGHSERRHVLGETSEDTGRKTRAAYDAGLVPILCVGETLEQRKSEQTEAVIHRHVAEGTANLTMEEAARLVIAYEPVWAIGTGLPATGAEAQRIAALVRGVVGDRFGPGAAAGVRIQYGGSVKAANATDFLGQPDVDGALVGGASLDPAEFARIVAAAEA
jgi:triosephosphate isomerase